MTFTLLPTPQKAELGKDTVSIGAGTIITAADKVDSSLRAKVAAMVPETPGATPIRLGYEPSIAAEGYRLTVNSEAIELAASTHGGWRGGIDRLGQICRRGAVRVGRIEDYPALPMRGYHIDFIMPNIGFEQALGMLEAMARWKLNTVLIEYYDRYPYRGRHQGISAPDALTGEQVQELLGRARSLGIEPIPLHQCLGHVEYILKHDAYADLREEQTEARPVVPVEPEVV